MFKKTLFFFIATGFLLAIHPNTSLAILRVPKNLPETTPLQPFPENTTANISKNIQSHPETDHPLNEETQTEEPTSETATQNQPTQTETPNNQTVETNQPTETSSNKTPYILAGISIIAIISIGIYTKSQKPPTN